MALLKEVVEADVQQSGIDLNGFSARSIVLCVEGPTKETNLFIFKQQTSDKPFKYFFWR